MVAVSPGLGLGNVAPRDPGVPPEHEPRFSVVELVGKLQAPLRQVTSNAHLAQRFRAYVGTLAAMKLVAAAHSMDLLDQGLGKTIAEFYLVAGSKTVPPSFRETE